MAIITTSMPRQTMNFSITFFDTSLSRSVQYIAVFPLVNPMHPI
jgi:hypothetical protein